MTGASPAAWRRVEPLGLSPLLLAALEVFHEFGYHGASVRDIATRAQVTAPTLYYHHGSKQGMLVALMSASVADVTDRARAALADAGGEPADQLAQLIEAIVLHMTHRADIAFLDSELRYLEEPERKSYGLLRKGVEDLVVDVLTRGRDRGDFTVPEIAGAARALLGMCQSIALWYSPTGPQTPEEVAALYVRLALQAVRGGPP